MSITLKSISDYEIREPDYVIQPFIEAQTLGLFFGAEATNKTTLMLQMMFCIASGIDFFDHKVKQGPVVGFWAESLQGVIRRLHALGKYYGINPADLPILICNEAPDLTNPQQVTEVIEALKPIKPVIVSVDTLQRHLGGSDENSTQDMTKFINQQDRIVKEVGCSICNIHHIGQVATERERGSRVPRASSDWVYRIAKNQAGIVSFENQKMKDFEAPKTMYFKLVSVDLGIQDSDGNEITAPILEPVDYVPAPAPKGKHQTEAIQILQDEIEEHRKNLLQSGRDPEGARVSLEAWKQACRDAGIDRKRFFDVKIALQQTGQIIIQDGFVDLNIEPLVIASASEVVPNPYPKDRTDTLEASEASEIDTLPTGQDGQSIIKDDSIYSNIGIVESKNIQISDQEKRPSRIEGIGQRTGRTPDTTPNQTKSDKTDEKRTTDETFPICPDCGTEILNDEFCDCPGKQLF